MKNKFVVKQYVSVMMIFLVLFLNILPVYAGDDALKSEPAAAESDLSNQKNDTAHFAQTGGKSYSPGDGLEINTFPDTSSFLNNIFPIDDRGYVNFPLLGKTQVSGMTEEQLVSFLKKNFQIYLKSPNISIRPMLRLSLIGGFVRPGLFYFDYDMSLWNAVQKSGGPSREDCIKDMQCERNGESLKDDLSSFFAQGVSLRNMGVKSGDIIWTPSPDAKSTWDVVTSDVLPVMAFAATLFTVWLTYQNTYLIYSSR